MLESKIFFTRIKLPLLLYLVDVFVLFSADNLLQDLSFSSYQSQIKHTLSFFSPKNERIEQFMSIFVGEGSFMSERSTGKQAYLVRPVSGSTTLRITLCLASYSSLVSGLLVDSRAFCSSVIATQKEHNSTKFLTNTCLVPHVSRVDIISHQVRAPPHHSAIIPGKQGV